jgi:hypothetical protein
VIGEQRPLLALGTPEVGERAKPTSRDLPCQADVRSARRATDQVQPVDAQRLGVVDGQVDEVDPEILFTFDLVGSVEDFRNAVRYVEGLARIAVHDGAFTALARGECAAGACARPSSRVRPDSITPPDCPLGASSERARILTG